MSTALITGASSGLGKGCARAFHRHGWNVVATMRNPEVDPAIGEGRGIRYFAMDVANEDSVHNAVDAAIANYGQIDLAINNAGIGITGLFEATSEREINAIFDVNLYGPMRVCRAILPHMRGIGRGVIANVTSAAGVLGMPLTTAYTASKFALEGFSEALSYELLSQNIVVKIVELGGIGGSRFSASSAERSRALSVIDDYSAFVAEAQRMFQMIAKATPAHADVIAESIFAAVTDGSDQLRYVVTEDVAPLIRLRRESSEERFMDTMRNRLPGRNRKGS